MSNLRDYMRGWPIELQTYAQNALDNPVEVPVDTQDSVKDQHLTAPPAGPAAFDRYIVAAVATGLWATKEKYIAEWSGTAWEFTAPNEGMLVWVEDEDLMYVYSAGVWAINPLIPTAGEKLALVGSFGTPGAANKYVTDTDPRVGSAATPPKLDAVRVSSGGVLAAGGNVVLVGRNLLQGVTFDVLNLTQVAPALGDITLHALKPGDSGITVQMIAGGAGLTITFNPATGALVITLAGGGSTDNAIATAINANGAQTDGYVRCVSATAGSFTLAKAAAPMTGGTGDYTNTQIMVAGTVALPQNETGVNPSAKWLASGILCTVPAVANPVDNVAVEVQVNGTWTDSVTALVDQPLLIPSLLQKLALAGTAGAPSGTNPYVTDADARFSRSGTPELTYLDVVAGAAAGVAAAGGDIQLVGQDFLQAQTFDTLTVTQGGANVDLHALKPGVSGFTVEMVVGLGAAVAFNPATGALVITVVAAGTADSAVAILVNANASACNGYIRANCAAPGGNFTAAQGPTVMAGGVGSSVAVNKVMVGGLEALPANEVGATSTAKWSNTRIICTTQAIGASADEVSISAITNGKWTRTLTALIDQTILLPTAAEKSALPYTPTVDQKAALAGTNGAPSAVNKYATDSDIRFTRVGTPELDLLDIVGGTAVLSAGGDVALVGRVLLHGRTFDTLTVAEGGASVALYALKPGDSGITVELIKGGGAAGVTFNPATGALVIDIGIAGSSDNAVATLINANAAQTNGYVRAVSATGGNFTIVQSQAPMTGGVGDYVGFKVMIGGLEALPANEVGFNAVAKWTNTTILCTSQAVGAGLDEVAIQVQVDGIWTSSINAMLDQQLYIPSAAEKAALPGTPTADEKAALLGTNGAPSVANKYVTNSDPRLTGHLVAGAPCLDRLNVAGVGGATVRAAGGDINVVGRNLLQAQTFDSLNRVEITGANITIFALKPGISGIFCEITATGGGPTIAFNPGTGKLVIDVGVAGRTSDQVATDINVNAAATDGYIRCTSAGAAFKFNLAQADTALAGGAGDYANNNILVSGLAALPANEPGVAPVAKWTDTGIVCTTQAVGLATDVVAIVVQSNALWSQPLSAALA